MTSIRKIEANRRNGRKSRGPQTAAGKFIASRNALRHGLAASIHRSGDFFEKVETLVRAIVGIENDPLLLEEARTIAECESLLNLIAREKVATVERLRNTTAIALVKGDNSMIVAKQRSDAGRRAYAMYERLQEEYDAHGKDTSTGQNTSQETRADDIDPPDRQLERDEYDAVKEALPDLERLERYKRRTWARRNRAMATFVAVKSSIRNTALAKQAKSNEGAPKGNPAERTQ
jgi:hypothetical protein